MRSSDEILCEVSSTIAHMHHRISMYIGSTEQPGAGNTLDGVFWMAHSFWALVQERDGEFRDTIEAVRQQHECSCQIFPDAYRRHNPDASEPEVCDFVIACWREIDATLGIDISEKAADLK
jgi:hypothetical protein